MTVRRLVIAAAVVVAAAVCGLRADRERAGTALAARAEVGDAGRSGAGAPGPATLTPPGSALGGPAAARAGDAEPQRAAAASPVVRVLASWSEDELALVARFERMTGRAASPALLALVDRRRAGAGPDELRAAATRDLADDPLGRAVALAWIRALPGRPGGGTRESESP